MATFNGKRVLLLCRPVPIDESSTIILRDEDGNEAIAVYSDEEPIFTATANDIREGAVAATKEGVTVGTKVIPSYNTSEGYRFIPGGSKFEIPHLMKLDLYDFTKLQVIICPFNESISKSVAAEKVVIDDKVYPVKSTTVFATVTKDSENKTIDLGFTNDSDDLYLIRYFTYKEIY